MTGSEAAGMPVEAAKNDAKYFFQKTTHYEAFLELGKVIKEILKEESLVGNKLFFDLDSYPSRP